MNKINKMYSQIISYLVTSEFKIHKGSARNVLSYLLRTVRYFLGYVLIFEELHYEVQSCPSQILQIKILKNIHEKHNFCKKVSQIALNFFINIFN